MCLTCPCLVDCPLLIFICLFIVVFRVFFSYIRREFLFIRFTLSLFFHICFSTRLLFYKIFVASLAHFSSWHMFKCLINGINLSSKIFVQKCLTGHLFQVQTNKSKLANNISCSQYRLHSFIHIKNIVLWLNRSKNTAKSNKDDKGR